MMCAFLKDRLSALKKLLLPLRRDDSLRSQFLLTYGTMTAVVTLIGLIEWSIDEAFVFNDLFDLMVNSYAPTTITFMAPFMFENYIIKSSKKKSSKCIFTIIFTALTYMAFEAIYIVDSTNKTLLFLGILAGITPLTSLLTLLSCINGSSSGNTTTSDGFASGRREIYDK